MRGLLIDTHYGVQTDKGVATDLEAGSKSRAKIEDEVGTEFVQTAERLRRRLGYKQGEGKREIFLCHAYCEVGATKFQDSLEDIRDFVIENPGEVVVLSIEDDVTPGTRPRSSRTPDCWTTSTTVRWDRGCRRCAS